MRASKKLAYCAVATAISVVALLVARYFPLLSLTPLMMCAVCFFVSLECGTQYGLLTIFASLGLGFLLAGFGSSFILCALIFAPYSILAHFIKKLAYLSISQALIRAVCVAISFNALLAIVVFCLGNFVDQLIFSYSLSFFLKNAFGYAILAICGTIIMLGFDFILCGLTTKLLKTLKIGEYNNEKRI